MFGFLNINKPKGITSHDVVAVLRRLSKVKQIGHTGTLDPLAQGVLPVAIGKASRLIEYLEENKGYIAKLQLGKVSDTYDTEGAVKEYSDKRVSKAEFADALDKFRGRIEQIPPVYSAVHYNGKRLYELARKGILPHDIPKRTVFINKLELIQYNEDEQTADIEVECSKGTYIRSLIHDIGLTLGSGAVMNGLIRTKSGLFAIDTAVPLDALIDKEDIEKHLINPIDVLSYKSYELSEFEYQKIKHGQSVESKISGTSRYLCLVYNNELCAIAEKEESSNRLVAKKVFV